jgi:Mitochondrial ribosomal subunit protein
MSKTALVRVVTKSASLLNRWHGAGVRASSSSGGRFLAGLNPSSGRQPDKRQGGGAFTFVGAGTPPYNETASSSISIEAPYVSPYQELLDRMHADGPTTLGTTQELLEFERMREQNQRALKCGILECNLRFTTTSFGRTLVAPHVHPTEHRVILKINTRNIPLDPTGVLILREIVGNRYNDERQELRLSSNQFGSRIENKRHLVSMLDRIVLSCQRLAAELDRDPLPKHSDNNHDLTPSDSSGVGHRETA